MKRIKLFIVFVFLLLPLYGLNKGTTEIEALGNYRSSLPQIIDLNDTSEDEIRDYYQPLTNLSASERQGTNLLKNLKPILSDMDYFSYENIWKIYEITDRDWDLSPAALDVYGEYDSTTNTYGNYSYSSSNTNTKNNPYVRTLYRNRDDSSGYITAWGDHNQSGTNREHVWCQSRGFKASKGAEGPAGTDLHHLKSGDGYVNQTTHNNYPYGYVDTSKSYLDSSSYKPFLAGNLRGSAIHQSSLDESNTVFEPQDSDKGDIARACFYMAARYNNFSLVDTITQFEPNLLLVNYATSSGDGEISSADHPVTMGILQDLLEWNKLDPVDEYEIHRNNLIYNNYQHNRNPFIDFPQWADYIWGTVSDGVYNPTVTGYADSEGDALNGISKEFSISDTSLELTIGSTEYISAFTGDNSLISWSVDDATVISLNKNTSHNNEEVEVSALKAGSATIEAKATISEEEMTLSCAVTVSEEAKIIDFRIDKTNISLEINSQDTIKATINEDVVINWSVIDGTIISLDKNISNSGETITITSLKEGNTTIKATVNFDGEVIERSCLVTVTKAEEIIPVDNTDPLDFIKNNPIIIAVIGGVVVLGIVIIALSSKNKKAKKVVKKKANQIVKKALNNATKKPKKENKK